MRAKRPQNDSDRDAEAQIAEYLSEKPPTKQTVASKEVYLKLGLPAETARDALAELAETDGTVVGERMDKGEARWRLDRG